MEIKRVKNRAKVARVRIQAHLALHKMKLKKDEYGKFKFIDHHYTIIGDRIRDMIYIKKSKNFILFMELDGSIAKVSLVN